MELRNFSLYRSRYILIASLKLRFLDQSLCIYFEYVYINPHKSRSGTGNKTCSISQSPTIFLLSSFEMRFSSFSIMSFSAHQYNMHTSMLFKLGEISTFLCCSHSFRFSNSMVKKLLTAVYKVIAVAWKCTC